MEHVHNRRHGECRTRRIRPRGWPGGLWLPASPGWRGPRWHRPDARCWIRLRRAPARGAGHGVRRRRRHRAALRPTLPTSQTAWPSLASHCDPGSRGRSPGPQGAPPGHPPAKLRRRALVRRAPDQHGARRCPRNRGWFAVAFLSPPSPRPTGGLADRAPAGTTRAHAFCARHARPLRDSRGDRDRTSANLRPDRPAHGGIRARSGTAPRSLWAARTGLAHRFYVPAPRRLTSRPARAGRFGGGASPLSGPVPGWMGAASRPARAGRFGGGASPPPTQ